MTLRRQTGLLYNCKCRDDLPPLSVFRSFSDTMPHSWSLDKRIRSDRPPQPAPIGQVSSRFACQTPRITHFLTIKPSEIHPQVIIYTEASQSEADPPFSNFTSPGIGRGQVLQRGEQLHLCDQSWGKPFGPFCLCCSLDNKIIAVKICVKFQKHFESRQQQHKRSGTKTENNLDICKQEGE